jgi:hypothetical protein
MPSGIVMPAQKVNAQSALEQKIALARSMGATDDQVKAMVLGPSMQGAPPDVPGDITKTGNDYLSTIPANQAA